MRYNLVRSELLIEVESGFTEDFAGDTGMTRCGDPHMVGRSLLVAETGEV